MFFYQRKYKLETRFVRMRDEWGQMRTYEVTVGKEEPTDEEIQRELGTTVIIRRHE